LTPSRRTGTAHRNPTILVLIPEHVPDNDKEATMMLKRPKQLVIRGAAVAALVLGGSAIAGAATGSSSSPSTPATLNGSGGGPTVAFTSPNTPETTVHANTEKTVALTDHERYVRHHQRLAPMA